MNPSHYFSRAHKILFPRFLNANAISPERYHAKKKGRKEPFGLSFSLWSFTESSFSLREQGWKWRQWVSEWERPEQIDDPSFRDHFGSHKMDFSSGTFFHLAFKPRVRLFWGLSLCMTWYKIQKIQTFLDLETVVIVLLKKLHYLICWKQSTMIGSFRPFPFHFWAFPFRERPNKKISRWKSNEQGWDFFIGAVWGWRE